MSAIQKLPTGTKPNILIFIPHDLGDYLGCYGHTDVVSPHIDSLATEGVRFTRYFTTAPECTPSRASMMTGLYTHQNGLMGLCHRGWEFSTDTVHLAAMLKDAGYQSLLFGLQHETHGDVKRLGYEHHYSADARDAPTVCNEMCRFLEDDSAKHEPWFAHVGFSNVHRPWPNETDIDPGSVIMPQYLPDTEDVRRDFARFYQSIKTMDDAIGNVLSSLETEGLADDTIVIFTTDHGSPFPRAKSTFFDAGMRIPLLARFPGFLHDGYNRSDSEKRAWTIDQLISNIDFTPTILELAGVDAPQKLEGRSFAPLLAGGDYTSRDAVFGALYYDAFYDPMHCVRTERYKYIRSFAVTPEDTVGADEEVLARHHTGFWIRADDSDVQNSDTWRALGDGDFSVPPPEELYDLEVDPGEEHNLLVENANDPGVEQIADELRDRMYEMMKRTSSPLLDGHVSPGLSTTRNQRVQ